MDANTLAYRITKLSLDEDFMQKFRELIFLCHQTAYEKGWWNPPKTIGEQIALYHAEISEALEEIRTGHKEWEIYTVKDKPEGFPIELADAFIRVFDTCGYYNIPLLEGIFSKMLYNLTRAHRHGNKVL